MNKRILLKAVTCLLLASVAVSCGDKKNKNADRLLIMDVDPRADQSMQRNGKDTATVMDLAKHYLELLKAGQTETALNMLVEFKDNKAMPLSAERKSKIMKSIKAFPVLDYEITELLMYSDSDTEVRYKTVFFEKQEGDNRPNTIQSVLNPCRVGNTWYLTIKESTREDNFKED